MENNDDKAKEDFLLRSVDSNETTDIPSSSKDVTKPITNKNNDSKNSKLSSKIIKNIIFLILIIVSIFYIFKSCDKDKTSYYDSAIESFNSGNTESGFDNINEAIEMDNQYADALLLRAKQYMKIEEYQDAEYDLTELINLDEKNWKAYYLRGKSYIGQATSKYSSSYEKAIKDFTKSIALMSGSENSDSYYLRGDCKEITLGKFSGCSDFTEACDLGYEKGCGRYNDLCYPKTGFMPYYEYFGEGVHSGEKWINLDNSKSTTDVLVVLQNKKTNIKIRSQFIRAGDELKMTNIPSGYYVLKTFSGRKWTFDAIMPDGLTRGGFTKDVKFEKDNYDFVQYKSWKSTLYKVEGGNANSQEINFNEFMN